jgi:hypothetical protein
VKKYFSSSSRRLAISSRLMEHEIKLQLRRAEHVKVLRVVKLMKRARTGWLKANYAVNLSRLEPVAAQRTPRLILLKGLSASSSV